jgi:ribosomal-protein-alanine N-acetyltransferase
MTQQGQALVFEPMTVEDIGDVMQIERLSFSAPWSARAYEHELQFNEMAHYFVARLARPRTHLAQAGMNAQGHGDGLRSWFSRLRAPGTEQEGPLVVGYVGYWLMAGEAHISTIAVRPEQRGYSYGEFLLARTIEDARTRGAHVATLEVRVSNESAQQLYSKWGFAKVGLRRGYYSDNNEDAYIMTTPPLNSPGFRQKIAQLEEALDARLAGNRQPGGRSGRRNGS